MTDPKGLRPLSGFENFTRGVVDVTKVFNISTAILLEDVLVSETELRESLAALQNKYALLQCYVAPIGKSMIKIALIILFNFDPKKKKNYN